MKLRLMSIKGVNKMKMINGCVSKDDSDKIQNMINIVNGIYVGRAGFTDENDNDVFGSQDIEDLTESSDILGGSKNE